MFCNLALAKPMDLFWVSMLQINHLGLWQSIASLNLKMVGYFGISGILKLGVFGKIPKFLKTEDVKIDFSGHFLFQIFATDKPLEIDP